MQSLKRYHNREEKRQCRLIRVFQQLCLARTGASLVPSLQQSCSAAERQWWLTIVAVLLKGMRKRNLRLSALRAAFCRSSSCSLLQARTVSVWTQVLGYSRCRRKLFTCSTATVCIRHMDRQLPKTFQQFFCHCRVQQHSYPSHTEAATELRPVFGPNRGRSQ